MNCDVKKLRCASLRSALQRCGALSLVPEILEFEAFRLSGKFVQELWKNFPPELPQRHQKQPQPSRGF